MSVLDTLWLPHVVVAIILLNVAPILIGMLLSISSFVYLMGGIVLFELNLFTLILVLFRNQRINSVLVSTVALRLHRSLMFLLTYTIDKILAHWFVLFTKPLYLSKVVFHKKKLMIFLVALVLCGQPLLLMIFFNHLRYDREALIRVRGGGPKRKQDNKKGRVKERKKFVNRDHSAHKYNFTDTELNPFNKKLCLGKKQYVDKDSDAERSNRFKHVKNSRTRALPVVANSAFNFTYYDHPFSFKCGDAFIRCSDFYYLIATEDGQGQWKHGNNTCLWDSLFGLFCNCMCVKNEADFDLALYHFNAASVRVTKAALMGDYGEDYEREYRRWLGDTNLLMADDLMLFMVTELNMKVIFVRNVQNCEVSKQTISELGEGTRLNGFFYPDLIAGVITNTIVPAHFTIVNSLILRHDFDPVRNANGEYLMDVKDLIYSFSYRNSNDCFFLLKKCPKDLVIEKLPDVAADLKREVHGCMVRAPADESVSGFSKEVRSHIPKLGSETTIYTKPVDCGDVVTDDEKKIMDDIFSGVGDVRESKPPVVVKEEEKASPVSDGGDGPIDAKGAPEGAELELVTTEPVIIKSGLGPDRFEGVTGRLVWNRRCGVPIALTVEISNNSFLSLVSQFFAENGLVDSFGTIMNSKIVRKYIELTQPRSFLKNTWERLRLFNVATYLAKANSRHEIFKRYVSARKTLEGVNQHIDNPKFMNAANLKFQNTKVEDSLQWTHWKTVDAEEVFDYAASVNQIHKKQILYLANLVEYIEVDWDDEMEVYSFINTCVEQLRAGIEIPRIYKPYYKKQKVLLYSTGILGPRRGRNFTNDNSYAGISVYGYCEVEALMDAYGKVVDGQFWDCDLNPCDKVENEAKPCEVKTVKVNDWDDLEDFERIMLLGSLSSCYKAINSTFMFDMGIVVELCTPKVISGQYDYDALCKRIDTVAASTVAKFKTNKLTSHYGVNLEMNSIRVAKCIARSYVEKLTLKQDVDELPDELVYKVRDSRTQTKDVLRVYGNSPLVNHVARGIIPYRTDEISNMPIIKSVVRNFKICHIEDQRESNTVVRKLTAVSNYNVYGCLSPIPDTSDANNVREGFMKRIGCAVPEPNESVKILLPMFVDHFINFYDLEGKISELMAGEIERFLDWDQYKLTLRYDPARLRQLEQIRDEVRVIETFDFADNAEGIFQKYLWTKIEAHVKWESYKGEMKYARLIFARVDWFKVFFGGYAKIMQKCIYECLEQFCCTNLPVKDLPKHMVEKYSLCSLILSTDFSAFESHNYPWIMKNIFFKFMVRMWSYEFDNELYVSMGVLTGTNVIENTYVWCKVDAKVMSGEVWTSITNWITNVIFIYYIVECEGYAYCTGFFSHEFSAKYFRGVCLPPVHSMAVFTAAGDDGMTGLPFYEWIDYSKLQLDDYLHFYGVNLKLEMKESIAGSGFLSKLYSENDMNTLCDPIKQLSKGILPLKYANAKVGLKKALARARAMSLLYEFGGCPIVASYALCIIRCTRNVQMKRALILMHKDDWYKQQVLEEAIQWYEDNVKGKYFEWKSEIGMESRYIIEDNFGIPVCTQLYVEEYFDSVDDTNYPLEFNVPCIDLVCSNVEQEFFELYTVVRKENERGFEVCISYQRERDWVSTAPHTASTWFDFLNRDCIYTA